MAESVKTSSAVRLAQLLKDLKIKYSSTIRSYDDPVYAEMDKKVRDREKELTNIMYQDPELTRLTKERDKYREDKINIRKKRYKVIESVWQRFQAAGMDEEIVNRTLKLLDQIEADERE